MFSGDAFYALPIQLIYKIPCESRRFKNVTYFGVVYIKLLFKVAHIN